MTGTLSEAIVRNRPAGGGILRGEQSGGEQPKHHQRNRAAAPVSDIHGHSPRQKIGVQYLIRDKQAIGEQRNKKNRFSPRFRARPRPRPELIADLTYRSRSALFADKGGPPFFLPAVRWNSQPCGPVIKGTVFLRLSLRHRRGTAAAVRSSRLPCHPIARLGPVPGCGCHRQRDIHHRIIRMGLFSRRFHSPGRASTPVDVF